MFTGFSPGWYRCSSTFRLGTITCSCSWYLKGIREDSEHVFAGARSASFLIWSVRVSCLRSVGSCAYTPMKCNTNAKKGQAKLLAAVMVMAIAFAGVAVVSDDSSAADATEETMTGEAFLDKFTEGSWAVDKDYIINISDAVTLNGTIKFTAGTDPVTVTIKWSPTAKGQQMFTGGGIKVGADVTVKMVVDSKLTSMVDDIHIMGRTALTINGGTVILTQDNTKTEGV